MTSTPNGTRKTKRRYLNATVTTHFERGLACANRNDFRIYFKNQDYQQPVDSADSPNEINEKFLLSTTTATGCGRALRLSTHYKYESFVLESFALLLFTVMSCVCAVCAPAHRFQSVRARRTCSPPKCQIIPRTKQRVRHAHKIDSSRDQRGRTPNPNLFLRWQSTNFVIHLCRALVLCSMHDDVRIAEAADAIHSHPKRKQQMRKYKIAKAASIGRSAIRHI